MTCFSVYLQKCYWNIFFIQIQRGEHISNSSRFSKVGGGQRSFQKFNKRQIDETDLSDELNVIDINDIDTQCPRLSNCIPKFFCEKFRGFDVIDQIVSGLKDALQNQQAEKLKSCECGIILKSMIVEGRQMMDIWNSRVIFATEKCFNGKHWSISIWSFIKFLVFYLARGVFRWNFKERSSETFSFLISIVC